MADHQSGSSKSSEKETKPGKAADRKHLGENGFPEEAPTPKQQDAADRTKMTVRHPLKLGSQELKRAISDK